MLSRAASLVVEREEACCEADGTLIADCEPFGLSGGEGAGGAAE
jgi:hypothetical protein